MADLEAAPSHLIARCAELAATERFPTIAGRILGLLLLTEDPISFDDLSQRLKISRGAVSSHTRLLEAAGRIERFTVPDDRRDYFRLAEPLGRAELERQIERLQDWRRLLHEMRDLPDGGASVDRRREALDATYALWLSSLETAARQLPDS